MSIDDVEGGGHGLSTQERSDEVPEEIREALRRFIDAAGPSWHSSIDGEQVDNLTNVVRVAFGAAKYAAYHRGLDRAAEIAEAVRVDRMRIADDAAVPHDFQSDAWSEANGAEAVLVKIRAESSKLGGGSDG